MRTWLVLAAVVAVAAAAVADALHGGLAKEARPATETAVRRIVPPGVPSGFMGTIVYSDPSEHCRLETLRLPGFIDVPPPSLRSCRFALSPDGTQAIPGEADWSPDGGVAAIPRGKTFELASAAAHQTILVTGSAPAFKPDGTLTFSLHGRLVEWSNRCRAGDRLFTLPGDNATARCVRTLLREPAWSVAWLTDRRFAAVLADDDLAIVDRGRTVVRRPLAPARGVRVESSPRGTFFTLWRDGSLVGAFDRDGGQIALPPLRDIRAIAWSPSERWAMLTTARASVYLFRPDTGDARLRRLDIKARDLAWR